MYTTDEQVDGRSFDRREAVAVAALAVLAIVVSLLVSYGQPLITPDSADYLSGAESLARGDGYRDFAGESIATFPPGYSAMIAIGIETGLTSSQAAAAVNALCAGVTVLLAHLLSRRMLTTSTARMKWFRKRRTRSSTRFS